MPQGRKRFTADNWLDFGEDRLEQFKAATICAWVNRESIMIG
jgi:hypothetical protein